MAKLIPLAPDSAAFKVLSRLYDLNGSAFVSQLTDVLWVQFRSPTRFTKLVTGPLTERGLAAIKGRSAMAITPEGRLMVESYRRSLPSPRIVSVNTKPLDAKKYLSFGQLRPGALEYREKPSIMAGEPVPFRRSSGGGRS